MPGLPVELARWWRGGEPSVDVAEQLAKAALVRAQVFLPIVMFALVLALVVSEPSGIPVTPRVLAVNLTVLAAAALLLFALRFGKVSIAQAHPATTAVWLLAPIVTLVSIWITGATSLTMGLMVELASLALLLHTRWAFVASVPVVIAAMSVMVRVGLGDVAPIAVVGSWFIGMAMQIALRRSSIRAETHRLNLLQALEALRHELAERSRAEADRETLRDQFVHAQRMDAVGTLSAGLAHDMNNILGGILAFAEILHAEATDASVREDLARIRHEAERGAALTRGLLAFSRRGAYRKRPIQLGGVLDDMAPLIERTLGKHVKIARHDGGPVIIDGDPAQLGQVLINLCLNGADAMSGEGTLSIETAAVELFEDEVKGAAPGLYARLSVADTGLGMDEATKARMFEPFFTTKEVGKGTGLGLAMVYGAVEAHGGTIDVITAPGRGTTVRVYLPLIDELPAREPRRDSQPALRRGLVLVVDDEATMRAGAARMIEQLGLTSMTASDGAEALGLFQQRRSDIALVLLDMAMPNMDGAACFHALRRVTSVPVLLMSGYTDHTAAQELLAAGAAGFLEKPYTAEQLGIEVERILGRSDEADPAAPATTAPSS